MHFYIQCFTISPKIKESVQYFIYSSMLQLIHFFSDRIFGLMCPTDLHILYDGAKKNINYCHIRENFLSLSLYHLLLFMFCIRPGYVM